MSDQSKDNDAHEDSDEQPAARPWKRKLIHVPTPGPVKFMQRARRAAEGLPLAGEAFKRLRETEDWAVAELKHRMDSIGESASRFVGDTEPGSAAERMAALFQAAKQNSSAQARELMYTQVLEQMVPEQARILAVVAQDTPTVMCHVDAGAPVGPVSRRVLSYATAAGRDAGIVLRDDVPRLVEHMVMLGLVEAGPEKKGIKAQYEMLETEDCVRQAIIRIKDEGRLWPRVQRHTLVLTEFGADLWRETAPAGVQTARGALTADS